MPDSPLDQLTATLNQFISSLQNPANVNLGQTQAVNTASVSSILSTQNIQFDS